MAVPSAQEIQEQIRQSQQLVGRESPSPQQSFHPLSPGGNYPSFAPAPYQLASMQNEGRAKTTPVNMGKLSLLAISFSLMLLGAFTFLGGFLLGIWVAGPRATHSMGGYIPPQQNMPYYSTVEAYPQERGRQRTSNFEQNMGRQLGSATEAVVQETEIPNVPIALSPLIRAAQSEIGKQAGEKTEDFLKQQTETSHPSSQRPFSPSPVLPTDNYSPQPSGPTQLPVFTPQSGALSGPSAAAYSSVSHENNGGYTVQLGVYASHENANALVNHMQALNYLSQVTEGKAPDGSKMYYVHSGYYKDYTTALSAASQFASQNIPGAIVVRVSQQNNSAL